MSDWRVAAALDQLLEQLNAVAPQRSKVADGAVGDTSHAARASDHNPARFSWALAPLVLARDFTHDPRGGLDCARLAAALRDGRDQRIAYVIWCRQIMAGAGGPAPWTWRPYKGASPHDHHLHVSLVHDARAQSRIPWLLPGLQNASLAPDVLHLPVRRPVAQLGSEGPDVALLRRWLGLRPGSVFDSELDIAVRRYQKVQGLDVDGVVGPRTWRAIGV